MIADRVPSCIGHAFEVFLSLSACGVELQIEGMYTSYQSANSTSDTIRSIRPGWSPGGKAATAISIRRWSNACVSKRLNLTHCAHGIPKPHDERN